MSGTATKNELLRALETIKLIATGPPADIEAVAAGAEAHAKIMLDGFEKIRSQAGSIRAEPGSALGYVRDLIIKTAERAAAGERS